MMNILHDYSLLAHNTFGIDARCQTFVESLEIKRIHKEEGVE